MEVPTAEYEYGSLSEILNPEWDSLYAEPIDHMYVIKNAANQREHWHVHLKTVDRYVLIDGELEVALFDERAESATSGTVERFLLSPIGGQGYHGLKIPAGVWHTFRSSTPTFTMLNNKFPRYNRADPDKYSIAFADAPVHFSW